MAIPARTDWFLDAFMRHLITGYLQSGLAIAILITNYKS